MLAAMRPTHTYPHPVSVHSRSDSRASSHSSSPVATPTRVRQEKGRGRSAANSPGPTSATKKSSVQRRATQPKQQSAADEDSQDFAKVPSDEIAAAQPAQTPGLLTLSKPFSEFQDDVTSSPSSQAKARKSRSDGSKKGDAQVRSRQPRSDSPSADVAAVRNAAAGAKASSRGSRRNNRAGGQPTSDDRNDPSVDLLSKSAPSGSHAHLKSRNKMAKGADVPLAGGDAGALTWQQELLRSSSGTPASKSSTDLRKQGKRGSPNVAAFRQHDGVLAQPQQVQGNESSALTWQQELFGGGGGGGSSNGGAKKKTSPQLDVFADARDAETFGNGVVGHVASNEGGRRRRVRAGSVGSGAAAVAAAAKGGKSSRSKAAGAGGADVPLHIDDLFNSSSDLASGARGHRRGQSTIVTFSQDRAPSTPIKKQQPQNGQHPSVAAAIAYAGPNFHNSPSPASLPAPKFSTRVGKADNGSGLFPASSLGASSSSSDSSAAGSDDEYEARRKVRSITAPAEVRPASGIAHATSPAPELASFALKAPATSDASSSKAMEPGATVESLLARMMGGAKFSM
ncbi:hypothetical protein ACQY0O_001590 [Thecaphora frezii]